MPLAADNVKVVLPLPGAPIPAGAKPAVTPAGSPVTASDSAELNPFAAAVLRPTDVEAPVATLRLEL